MARAQPTAQQLCERLARARPTKTPASPKRSGPFRQLGEGCEHRLQLAGRERSECTKVQREEYKASTRGPPEGGSQKREREEGKGAELGPAGRMAHPLFPWPPRGEGRDPSPRALEELGQGKGGGRAPPPQRAGRLPNAREQREGGERSLGRRGSLAHARPAHPREQEGGPPAPSSLKEGVMVNSM